MDNGKTAILAILQMTALVIPRSLIFRKVNGEHSLAQYTMALKVKHVTLPAANLSKFPDLKMT